MQPMSRTNEIERRSSSGYLWIAIGIVVLGIGVFLVVRPAGLMGLAAGVLTILAGALILAGLYMLQPNEAAILLLFGEYVGTDRAEGLRWANPFYRKQKISLRAHNLMSERLKVNDKRGNPIEIAAAIVWRVHNTAQAVFDVEDYDEYVRVQAEAAIRHLASSYAYDEGEHEGSDETDAARQPGPRDAGADPRTGRPSRPGRHRGRGRQADASRLRAGDRAGDAAPPAGRGDHRGAQQDRAWARSAWSKWRSRACRSATSCTWTTSAAPRWSATCWWCCAPRRRHSR